MRKSLIIFFLFPTLVFGQIGGQASLQVLNIPTNPRSAGLGGTSVSLNDGDLSQFFENPALLDSVENTEIFSHINPFFADANVYSIAYAFDSRKMKGFALGLNYLDFGSFERTDESGNVLGTFQASDFIVTLGKSHTLGPMTLGVNLKFARSQVDSYSSSAILADLGGVFQVNSNWSVAMVFKNMGTLLANELGNEVRVPFDVKLGTSFKPNYMPMRFTLTSNNLLDENKLKQTESEGRTNQGVEKVLRRITIGSELLLSEHFQVLFGYNHKRKQELRLPDTTGGAGFSYGFMIRINRFQFRFSRATYHTAGGSSYISLQSNLNDFRKIL